jgi:hypothetical protein
VTTDLLLTLAAAAEARARDVKTREVKGSNEVDAAAVLVFLWPVVAVEPAAILSTSPTMR